MKPHLIWAHLALPLLLSPLIHADNIDIELTLPALDVDPYHRPYVAIWLESPKREGIQTLSVWTEKDDWLKDMRQWWRKLGRKNRDFDAVSSATRHAGHYTLQFTTDQPAGEYRLCFEASREDGGREFLSQTITLGDQPQHFNLTGQHEFGNISVGISPETKK